MNWKKQAWDLLRACRASSSASKLVDADERIIWDWAREAVSRLALGGTLSYTRDNVYVIFWEKVCDAGPWTDFEQVTSVVSFGSSSYGTPYDFADAIGNHLTRLAGREIDFIKDTGKEAWVIEMPLTHNESVEAICCHMDSDQLIEALVDLIPPKNVASWDSDNRRPERRYGGGGWPRELRGGRELAQQWYDPDLIAIDAYLLLDNWVAAVDFAERGGPPMTPWLYARWAWEMCLAYDEELDDDVPLQEAEKIWPGGLCEFAKRGK